MGVFLAGGAEKALSVMGADSPGKMKAFMALFQEIEGAGALSRKEKELIAVALSVSRHCDSCIDFHVSAALKAGATKKEIGEAVWVAVLMGGGPDLVYGAKAVEAAGKGRKGK